MKPMRHYLTALPRYHRSRGFGIHSPFAFGFVAGVIREKCQYYAYERIANAHKLALNNTAKRFRNRVISLKKAELLFRVTNYFNPQRILQIGTGYGLTESAMLLVNSSSELYIYDPTGGAPSGTNVNMCAAFQARIHSYAQRDETFEAYGAGCEGQPYVLVNEIADEADCIAAELKIFGIMDHGGVIVMRNLMVMPLIASLWNRCKAHMGSGQTFSNGKEAVIVPSDRPLEHFALWF